MNEKKNVIPPGMLQAARDSRMTESGHSYAWSEGMCRTVLTSALRWLTENPIQLSDQAFTEITDELPRHRFLMDYGWLEISNAIQRRMFLAPEGPFDAMLDAAVERAPAGAIRIDICTPEGRVLASREIYRKEIE